MKFAFHQILLISLLQRISLEQWPKCILKSDISLTFTVLW